MLPPIVVCYESRVVPFVRIVFVIVFVVTVARGNNARRSMCGDCRVWPIECAIAAPSSAIGTQSAIIGRVYLPLLYNTVCRYFVVVTNENHYSLCFLRKKWNASGRIHVKFVSR